MAVEPGSKAATILARQVWRSIAPERLRRVAQPLAMWARLRQVEALIAAGEPTLQPGPVIVSGFATGFKGISEGMRLTLAGLRCAGFDPIVHDLRPHFTKTSKSWPPIPAGRMGGVWFLHMNPPEMVYALSETPKTSWAGRYRIGYWAYELEKIPFAWARAAHCLHEIWTPSRFVADSLSRSGVTTPVRVMPHPVSLGSDNPCVDIESTTKPALDAPFVVLTLGDFASSAARKNLAGAIQAYMRAFNTTDAARLIVKIRQPNLHARAMEELRQAARQRPDISFVANDLSASEIKHLIASSDLLLSLHRAEGFGLALAEAFLADVPALATGWSGNLEFMDEIPELLVDYSMVSVKDPAGIYRSRDLLWAEPDIDAAARKLRELADAPELRRKLANRGKIAVEALAAAWQRDSLMATSLGSYAERRRAGN